jgi:hypothetical protein
MDGEREKWHFLERARDALRADDRVGIFKVAENS